MKPTTYAIGTPYGYKSTKNPRLWAAGYHTGTDFVCPTGTKIVATASGKVVGVGNIYGLAYGRHQVVIETVYKGKTVRHLYAHMKSFAVNKGQHVSIGQKIGVSAAEGNTFGAHLHYEERKNKFGYYDSQKPVLLAVSATPAVVVKTVAKVEHWVVAGKLVNLRDEPVDGAPLTTLTKGAKVTSTAYQKHGAHRWVRVTIQYKKADKNVWIRRDLLTTVAAPTPTTEPVKPPVVAPVEPPTVPLTLSTYNVAAQASAYMRKTWKTRLPRIAKNVLAPKADVVVIQEAGNAKSTYLNGLTSALKPYKRAGLGGKWRYIWFSKTVKRTKSGLHNLPKSTLQHGTDQKEVAWMSLTKGGVKALVLNLHLENEDGKANDALRVKQALAALDFGIAKCKSLGIPRRHLILAGDMNSRTQVAEAMRERGWLSAATTAKTKKNATYASHNNFAKSKVGPSLDHIFVHKDIAVDAFTQTLDHVASDHNQLTATILLETS